MRHLIFLLALVGCTSSLTPGSGGQDPLSVLSSVNNITSISQLPNDPLYSQQDYLNTANVPLTWQTTTGSSSQKIAVITMGGINNNHEDLQSRVTIETSASSPLANNGAGNPGAGIIGAATNNGKGIAGVNWSSNISSYNIAKKTTKTVHELSSGVRITKSFVNLNGSAVGPAINDAVTNGAKTIYLPLNWLLEGQVPELVFSDFQFYPCCEVENPYRLIYDNVSNIIKSIIAVNKQNNDYGSAISAVKNAYLNDAVVVGNALQYDGFGIGFPANLASEHVVLTVGASNLDNQPFQFSGVPEADETSNDSKDINLIAPGVDLHTTLPASNQYGDVSGTGASSALVTGIVSLLQSAEEDLTPDDVAHILEKTAVPVAGPGYDDQSGYGLINAGAAMDYVNSHDIKHAITTDGQVEEVSTGESMTLYSSVWEELPDGIYIATKKHKVTYTIPLVPSSNNDLWFNAKGTYGWGGEMQPNDQNRYAQVELFNDHARVTTFIYKLYDRYGRDVGWHPTSPDNLQLSYSYVGNKPEPSNPFNVSINGPSYVNDGQSATFTADVSGAGSVSYQWYYKRESYSGYVLDGSSPTYEHTFHVGTGDEIDHSAVKVEISSAGETATDVHSVDVSGCQGGLAPNSHSQSIGIQRIALPPCD